MNIIQYKKIFLGIGLAMVIAALAVILVRGLSYSIEFTGGSLFEISYSPDRPAIDALAQAGIELGYDLEVQPFGDDSYLIKTGTLDESSRQALGTSLTSIDSSTGVIERYTNIGPSVGRELRTKSLYGIIFVSLAIVAFVAYAFRQVSRPVSSWKYGVVAVIALLHDLIIPIGILTLLGVQIDTLYVVGLLSILGLSVNDTIVVFDRIRENLQKNKETGDQKSFADLVNQAVNQTLIRSVLTSLTLVVVLCALMVAGPATTQTLALVLLLGTLVGTYSSIFIASPLLTFFAQDRKHAE